MIVTFVGRGPPDFRGNASPEIGDFFRAFIDEQTVKFDFGPALGDSLTNMLEEGRFTRPRRSNNQSSLPHSDGAYEIHEPHRQLLGAVFEPNPRRGVHSRPGKEPFFGFFDRPHNGLPRTLIENPGSLTISMMGVGIRIKSSHNLMI
jgi:hypothetical protein